MSTRAQLQTKSIAELRQIAEAVGVESDGLQKSKLISALMAAGGMTEDGEEASMVDLPTATPRSDENRSNDFTSTRRPTDRTPDSDLPDDARSDESRSGQVSSDGQADAEGDADEGSVLADTSDSSEGGSDDR